jgi:hypothetical protein
LSLGEYPFWQLQGIAIKVAGFFLLLLRTVGPVSQQHHAHESVQDIRQGQIQQAIAYLLLEVLHYSLLDQAVDPKDVNEGIVQIRKDGCHEERRLISLKVPQCNHGR